MNRWVFFASAGSLVAFGCVLNPRPLPPEDGEGNGGAPTAAVPGDKSGHGRSEATPTLLASNDGGVLDDRDAAKSDASTDASPLDGASDAAEDAGIIRKQD